MRLIAPVLIAYEKAKSRLTYVHEKWPVHGYVNSGRSMNKKANSYSRSSKALRIARM
jgi:hypothetical protein